jgi:DNA-binding MarR family transcriptional regulator
MHYNQLNRLIKLGREFGHDKIRGAGFSDTEHAICTFLCFHDQVSQDTISAALLLDKTTVAKALQAMERKGLIDRRQNEQNRRQNVIQITEAGRSSVAKNVDIYDQWLTSVCSCLSDQEQQQFNDAFDRIVKHALRLRQHQQTIELGKAKEDTDELV